MAQLFAAAGLEAWRKRRVAARQRAAAAQAAQPTRGKIGRVARAGRSWIPLALVLGTSTLGGLATACSSPNRGTWRGTFQGSVNGTVEFRINTSGTELDGSLTGQTTDGAPFNAEMEGKINGEFFYATFAGRADSGMRPIPFEGFLRGQLGAGTATGDWECELRFTRAKMSGKWEAKQESSG